MPTIPGTGGILAVAGLAGGPNPWGRREAEKQNELAMAERLNQLIATEAAQKRADEMDIANRFAALSNAPFLAPDKERLNSAFQAIKNKVKDQIKNEYGGNGAKWLEQGEALNLAIDLQNLKNSQAYTNGVANATTYELAASDAAQGKMQRLSTYKVRDASSPTGYSEKTGKVSDMLLDYQNGLVDKLNYAGAINIPKDFGNKFSKITYTGNVPMSIGGKNYTATRFGLIDPETKALVGAVPVQPSDLRADWLAKGGTESDFAQYMANVGKNHGFEWKSDDYNDFLNKEKTLGIQEFNAQTSRMNANNTNRHQKVTESQGWARLNLAERKFEESKKSDGVVDPVSVMFSAKDTNTFKLPQAKASKNSRLVVGQGGLIDFEKDKNGNIVQRNTNQVEGVSANTGPFKAAMKAMIPGERVKNADGVYRYVLRNFSSADDIFTRASGAIDVQDGDMDFGKMYTFASPNGGTLTGVMAFPKDAKYPKGVFIPISQDPTVRMAAFTRSALKTVKEAANTFADDE